jgi:hypothetical protein
MNESKPAALAKVASIANEFESAHPNARNLVRELFAAFAEIMDHFHAPQPMSSLNSQPGMSYALFCPDQGGWRIGTLRGARWMDSNGGLQPLNPTHWLTLPELPPAAQQPAPAGDAVSGPATEGVSLFITRAQKAMLRERGFDDEAIRHMTPEDAHRHLRLRA